MCWRTSPWRFAGWFTAIVLSGCGYVGDPLPPSLNIPARVTNLTAVQRGPNLVISFTTPAVTTEDLGIIRFDSIDLRIGEKSVPQDIPEPGKPVTVLVPSSDWTGREVAISVRLGGPKGRMSEPSNTVAMKVGAALPRPEVEARTDPAGVRLRWPAAPGVRYQIARSAANEAPATVGTTAEGEFVDKSAVFGKEYAYAVQAFADRNESEPSANVTIVPRDEFSPAAPTGVTAVAGQRTIELSWDRNKETDLASYRVYRAAGDMEFTVLADAVEGTAFSDRQTASGTAYRYEITATDKSGNESERSKALAVTAP